ncbi:MAG: Ig-like domain-containing protein [Gemmatimonadota bacterium]|nr:Ig-like domain-containing protein [Gemmatimonadota bacterium]
MRFNARAHRQSLTFVLAALVAGCGGGGGGGDAPTAPADQVSGIGVSPASPSVTVGNSLDFTAATLRSDGSVINAAVAVTWSVSDGSKGTITASGRFTGTGEGSTYVNATLNGKVGQALVTVKGGVASVTITPAAPSVAVGGAVQLTAVATDAQGAAVSGLATTWTSGTASVATVSSAGLVTGVAAGTATITATIAGKSASVTVTVASPGFTIALSPASLSLTPGGAGTVAVTVTRTGGFADAVTITAEGLPTGVTTAGTTIGAGSSSANLVLTASSGAPASGATNVTIRARATGLSDRTATLPVTVASTSATFVGTINVPRYRVYGTSSLSGATCYFDITWGAATLTLSYSSTSPGGAATIQLIGRRISTPVTATATGPGGTSNCIPGDDTHGGTTAFASNLPQVSASVAYAVYGNTAVTETAAFNGTANGGLTSITGTLTFTYSGTGRGGEVGSTTVTLTRQ